MLEEQTFADRDSVYQGIVRLWAESTTLCGLSCKLGAENAEQ